MKNTERENLVCTFTLTGTLFANKIICEQNCVEISVFEEFQHSCGIKSWRTGLKTLHSLSVSNTPLFTHSFAQKEPERDRERERE
jgi:hypothetical protein